MKHVNDDDDDFREVYYDFYLKARSSVFAKKKKEGKQKKDNKNWDVYFQLLKNPTLLQNATGKEQIEQIVEELRQHLSSHRFEFSFATKLLHTKDPRTPIYDSKVRKYLKTAWKKRFTSESSSKLGKLAKIKEDWKMLNEWYDEFLKSDTAKKWIEWFDKTFPNGKDISPVKKVDFIIFACVD
jgi:hypothetical protein